MRIPILVGTLIFASCSPENQALIQYDATDDIESTRAALTCAPIIGAGRSIHLAKIDLCEPGIELRATGPSDGTRTVKSFAALTNAIVAINGGHSWGGVPSISASGGNFFGNADQGDVGQAVFGDGLAEFIHMSDSYQPMAAHKEVLSGLLTLVHNGESLSAQLPNNSPTCSVQHPRTLLGLTQDKRTLLMVVVDGRNPAANRLGMTCAEAANFMRSQGAYWALNLDGGGSSEMVVGGRIVNVPSDGNERAVPTHLAVVKRAGARGHCPVIPVVPPVTVTPPTTANCGTLLSDAALERGQEITSCNGRFVFAHQTDGNVVLYDGPRALWSSRTNGKNTGVLAMQSDGNLVLYSPTWAPLWHTRTHGRNGAIFTMQNDGNAVISNNASVVWQSRTAVAPGNTQPVATPPIVTPPVVVPPVVAPPMTPTVECGFLRSGNSLGVGASVKSCDGRFELAHQTDGNVVLYQGETPIWSTRTNGRATSEFAMQTDGNLVLYGANGQAIFNTHSAGKPGAQLAIQNDGNVVIYFQGQAVWHTQTCCR